MKSSVAWARLHIDGSARQNVSNVMIETGLAIVPRSGGPMLTRLKLPEEPGLRGPLRYQMKLRVNNSTRLSVATCSA